ncbi:uncharacterized protein LOC133643217 isoform X3 [Entelurus aequoreus]|uniref:uncharacterized protein LOC133643217 isoform X3 n=1 Tax=Entelurus aequoreus TaxID=161455 RepID=UPI002B1D8C43|nr:uncharacterized protein LOC133643217 isoform X3 [Entelurus aequoreus]
MEAPSGDHLSETCTSAEGVTPGCRDRRRRAVPPHYSPLSARGGYMQSLQCQHFLQGCASHPDPTPDQFTTEENQMKMDATSTEQQVVHFLQSKDVEVCNNTVDACIPLNERNNTTASFIIVKLANRESKMALLKQGKKLKELRALASVHQSPCSPPRPRPSSSLPCITWPLQRRTRGKPSGVDSEFRRKQSTHV